MPTQDEAIRKAGQIYAQARQDLLALTPESHARQLHADGTYRTYEESLNAVLAHRGLPPAHAKSA